MMFELGCHVLDLVIGVLGKPKEVAAVQPALLARSTTNCSTTCSPC